MISSMMKGALYALVASSAVHLVDGHGYLSTPRSRNWVAHEDINSCDQAGGLDCPPPEYCYHCLNMSDGVCGKTNLNSYENGVWLDRSGAKMSFQPQATYQAGQEITVDSVMSTHHGGHMTIAYCVMNNGSGCTTPAEFEGNELEFVRDLTLGGVPMPKDENYPERGYYSQWGTQSDFSMIYKLPDGLVGQQILLRYRYVTANSCLPPGYEAYFTQVRDGEVLPSSYWKGANMKECSYPLPNDGSRSEIWPEQFYNCAEVSIEGDAAPTTPAPTGKPATASPTASSSPTFAPGTCIAMYSDCTSNASGCCSGLACSQVDAMGSSVCLEDICSTGPSTKPPTPPPSPPTPATPSPSKKPSTPSGAGCCSRDLGTCTHLGDAYCNANKENCEGPCGKHWLEDGDISDTCSPLWESCRSDSDCCLWSTCGSTGSCEHDGTWKPPAGWNSPTSKPTVSNPTTTPPTSLPSTLNPTTPNPTRKPTAPQPTSKPTPSPTLQPNIQFPDVYSSAVRVNQVGYLRAATKVGVIVSSASTPLEWQVQDDSGSVVLSGLTTPFGLDEASGDEVHQADFSQIEQLGSFRLVVDGVGSSLTFSVAPSLYPNLPHEAMNYFYFHRMGPDDILAEHLIDERYARIALHPKDTAVPAYPGWCQGCDDFDLLGSWADAGDFGVYTVNHAISAWTLLNLHELFPSAFTDGTLNLPESGNNVHDILDEVDYGSRFVRGMLPKTNGQSNGELASHKAHNHAWSAFTITIESENAQNGAGTRSAMGSSTAATFAVARVNAQLARTWHAQGNDAAYVTLLWEAAEDAWNRAYGTNKIYNAGEASPGPAVGGGDYPDSQIADDEYAAACEMYLAALSLGVSDADFFKSIVVNSSFFGKMEQWDWASVAGAGTLSLYAVSNDLSPSQEQTIKTNILAFADKIKTAIDEEGYPSNLNFPSEFGKYPWGSNSFIVNRMIALAYAYEVSGDISYQKYLMRSMDYVMGTNAMDISYVTGYGDKAETDTHDRWAWTIGQDEFWPRGWLSGGPNNELINDYETPGGVAAAKSYADPGTAPHAWGSKENTVNWNSPLAWVAWYIENKVVPNLGGCDGNCAPVAKSQSSKVQMNESVSLVLVATDYDGADTALAWTITDTPKLGSLSGTAPNLVYTPFSNTRGVDTFSFIVTDNNMLASNKATVTLTIRDCDYMDIFQLPSSYPPLTVNYNYVHVSEDGPNFGQTRTPFHKVQVGSQIDQFAMEFDQSPYYLDLKRCMSSSSLASPASISLSGCGISGLDGDYWIGQDGGNSIWVEKSNRWAIIFTNDVNLSPEFCRTTGPPPPPTTASPTSKPTPAPTSEPISPTAKPTPSPTSPPVVVPTTVEPTKNPTNNPTKNPSAGPSNPPTPRPSLRPSIKPTPKPTSGSNVCCTNRNLGYQTCDTNNWCNANANNCSTCGGVVMEVPLERNGCCTWGGDCASWNPENNRGCQYKQSDCESDCGGTWQFF
mmetsp:Transcript_12986/g.29885  ORF Transcript_12986/g.29885 Transcript_12986/m.29885 type:complete len:1475 (-) Transcript_12986:105-4529(-)